MTTSNFSIASTAVMNSSKFASAERINRQGDRSLGYLHIDTNQFQELGKQRIGLLAAGFVRFESMVERLIPWMNRESEQLTIFLYPSRNYSLPIYDVLYCQDLVPYAKKVPESWRIGSCLFTSIESLRKLRVRTDELLGVVLLDPSCMVYKARQFGSGFGSTNDRPQRIVDFLESHTTEDHAPGFLLATTQNLMALPTESIARVYCREAWWFLDGNTLTCPAE